MQEAETGCKTNTSKHCLGIRVGVRNVKVQVLRLSRE